MFTAVPQCCGTETNYSGSDSALGKASAPDPYLAVFQKKYFVDLKFGYLIPVPYLPSLVAVKVKESHLIWHGVCECVALIGRLSVLRLGVGVSRGDPCNQQDTPQQSRRLRLCNEWYQVLSPHFIHRQFRHKEVTNSRNQGFSYYFAWWWKDPEPDPYPYLWRTDPDSDPGDLNIRIPNTGSGYVMLDKYPDPRIRTTSLGSGWSYFLQWLLKANKKKKIFAYQLP